MIKKKTQILYLALNGIGLGLGVTYTAVLARLLGPETFGQFSVLQNVGFLLVPLTSIVPNLVFSTKYKNLTGEIEYPALFRFILLLSAVSLPLVFLLLTFLPIAETATNGQKLMAILNIYAAIQLLLVQSFYQTRDLYDRFLKIQILSVGIKIIILALVQYLTAAVNLEIALMINFLVTVGWVIGSVFDLRLWQASKVDEFKPANNSLGSLFKHARVIFGPSVLLSLWAALLYSLDILMAQRSFAAVDLSVYAVISSISKISILLPSALTPIVLQFGYKNRGADSSSSSSGVILSVALTLMAGSVLSFIGQLAAPYLLPLLFRREFVFQGWAVPAATLAMTVLSVLSFYVHYDFGRGRYGALAISGASMMVTLIAYFFLPKNIDIANFCLFILAWPIGNSVAILAYQRFV